MYREILGWRFWDQSRAVENARMASVTLTVARRERLDVEAFVARMLAGRGDGRSA